MKKRATKLLLLTLCIFSMILLIFDSKHAIEGAKEGVMLCLYTVIPTLFPFCVLSILFRTMISNRSLPLVQTLERFCGMPEGCGTIFFLGLVGGYPIGAICIEQAVKEKCIEPNEAKHLRAVCNNAGPSFIIGMLAGTFQKMQYAFCLIVIQALSALLACLLLSRNSTAKIQYHPQKNLMFTDAIKQACSSMVTVCGIIILFRVFMNIVKAILSPIISIEAWVVVVGILELTNGINLLSNLMQEELMFMVAAGMLAFGGICVAVQTMSVSSSGAGKYYLIGKAIQATISIILACIYINLGNLFIIIYIGLFSCVKLIKTKSKNKYNISKNSSNSNINAV